MSVANRLNKNRTSWIECLGKKPWYTLFFTCLRAKFSLISAPSIKPMPELQARVDIAPRERSSRQILFTTYGSVFRCTMETFAEIEYLSPSALPCLHNQTEPWTSGHYSPPPNDRVSSGAIFFFLFPSSHFPFQMAHKHATTRFFLLWSRYRR